MYFLSVNRIAKCQLVMIKIIAQLGEWSTTLDSHFQALSLTKKLYEKGEELSEHFTSALP